ncbi:MAG TPA: hypothetical protein VNI81_09395 [Candidatus Limnocylindrales bacterium]|nr:hypothetical protein [Candidatus Limnocylindrales bacterium]
MHRFAAVVMCSVCVFAGVAQGQNVNLEAVRAKPGTVLTFYLQTRLNPTDRNELDVLPRGTVIRVRLLDAVDSGVDHDGSEFRGEVVEPVLAEDKIMIHPESEVRGLLVLLRSRNHPEGFRYELLVTSITDHAKRYDLTASLNRSFIDAGPPAPQASKEQNENERKTTAAGTANVPATIHK